MDPKWVMTNEQKKIRFQHYFKKKQEREAAGASTTTTTKMERFVFQCPQSRKIPKWPFK